MCCRASTSYTWTVSCRGSSKPTRAPSAATSSAQTVLTTRNGGGTSSESRGRIVRVGPAPSARMPRLLPVDGPEQDAVAPRRQSLACTRPPAPLQTRVAAAAPSPQAACYCVATPPCEESTASRLSMGEPSYLPRGDPTAGGPLVSKTCFGRGVPTPEMLPYTGEVAVPGEPVEVAWPPAPAGSVRRPGWGGSTRDKPASHF